MDPINENEPLAAAAMSAAVKDAVNNPAKGNAIKCRSCGHMIDAKYCANCGQSKDDLRRSLWRLIGESLGGLFSFDSKIWKTWGALLFKPGKVAREYAHGARTKYSPPIRVYIVVSFLFFLLLAFSGRNLIAFIVDKAPEAGTAQTETVQADTDELDLNGYNVDVLFFSTQAEFKARNNPDNITGFIETFNEGNKITVSDGDDEPMTIDQNGLAAQMFENPKLFNQAFTKWLPRIMFVMVPMAMFFGAIFIRGKNALLYDHLVHALYIHAVLFFALSLALILAPIVPGKLLAYAFGLFFLIYLPVSTKGMFRRGWFKSVLTTGGVAFLYAMFMIIAISGISVYSISQLVA